MGFRTILNKGYVDTDDSTKLINDKSYHKVMVNIVLKSVAINIHV